MEYRNVELSELIEDIAAGPFGSNLKVSTFTSEGFPIIDGANLKEVKLTDNITKFVTENKARSLSRSIAKRGDVVVTISGNVGQISYIPENSLYKEYLCSQRQFRVTFDESKVYVPYLVYYFHTREGRSKILSFANQTGVPALSQPLKNFKKICIKLPSLEIQRKSVKAAELLTDKIELNNQLNDYLTDLSSAIYNEFINRSSGKWGTLSDIVDLIKEPISSRTRPELPYLPIDVIPMKRIGIEGFRPYEEAKSSLQLFKKDDIVIGAMRVYFHRVILTPCKGMTRNTCFVLRPRSKNLREFALLSCFQNETIEFANLHSKGSTMPYAVWKGSFENCPAFIPNEHDLEVFSIRMSPLIDKIRDIYKENSTLINLRNGLLSQLLSGKIDLSKFN